MNNPAMRYEYAMVLKVKAGISSEKLSIISDSINKAFDNRAGKAVNASIKPDVFIFQGNEDLYGCLDLGAMDIGKRLDILDALSYFAYIDRDEPAESCDLIELYKAYYHGKA